MTNTKPKAWWGIVTDKERYDAYLMKMRFDELPDQLAKGWISEAEFQTATSDLDKRLQERGLI